MRLVQVESVFKGGKPIQSFTGYVGQANGIYESIISILKVVLRNDGNIRLGVGDRKNRNIAVMKDEKIWVPNIFQLSSGELQLINLFLSIIRDYDLSNGNIKNLADIKGVVIIDEIDANLHTVHQKEILPTLIASFPNVQFIISTHSPLFLLGMESRLGDNNFEVINMPNGERFAANDFSEFKAAYDAFAETRRHREEINRALEERSQAIVYVEGDYDIRYLQRAAILLNKSEILNKVQLKDGDGFGNLDKIWRAYDNPIADALPSRLMLLYDCDTKKPQSSRGKVFRRVMPTQSENPIQVGIENLFLSDTIKKAESFSKRFIDVTPPSVKRTRGEEVVTAETKSVNKDEKGNLCDWICEHGTKEDFKKFSEVFSIIEEVLSS